MKPLIPETPIVFCISKASIKCRVLLVDQFLCRRNYSIRRWAIESWDGDPFNLVIHHSPVKYTLVEAIG